MDPHRSYPDDPEPRWFGGEQQYGEPEWEGYQVPDPRGGGDRYADARYGDAPVHLPGPGARPVSGGPGSAGGGPIGPRSGEPLPPLEHPGAHVPPRDPTVTRETPPVPGEPPRHYAEAIDRTALRRPAAPAPVSDGIYRARRPGTALLVAVAAAVAAVPLTLGLVRSVDSPISVSGILACLLALLALPLAALGTYGLATGAARMPDATPVQAWLRPPLAYLFVALVLFVAAGLAAG